MATRSQRRKEKKKKKERKKKREQQRKRQGAGLPGSGIGPVGNSRHQQRILRQKPEAWPGESPEDVAIFDDAALESLTPELSDQAEAVRDALQLACDCQGDQALQRVSGIARSSPLSEWRLFLRGLVAWSSDDYDAASEAWARLNFDRRPGRMAIAMMNSVRTDLQNASVNPDKTAEADDTAPSEWTLRLDAKLLYHAKLLRQVRFDRPAIKLAEANLRIREESKDLLLGPKKLRWLKQFVREYRDMEPDLISALQQAALARAFAQSYADLFEKAVSGLEGPPHDRKNLFLSFFYFAKFEDDNYAVARREQAREAYLEQDLPNNEELSEPLRAAIASQIHLEEAKAEIEPSTERIFAMFEEPEDTAFIRQQLNAAAKTYPANRSAYETHFSWLENKLEDDRLNQKQREPYLKEQARVMTKWSQSLPDDVKPRLWLVDYLLNNEQTEKAKPHVDWLAAARQDDPLVRATPWKWQLLEAMRLCRRKAWLKQVPAHLDEAERLWPAWLSQEWLPYLRAAVTLRAGNSEEFEAQRQHICQQSGIERDSLADACMMLGAAQHMRVPSADLKPLRAPVDRAVKNLDKLSDEELLSVSGFFWDLRRTQLAYPAYRMHGGKIVDQLFGCFEVEAGWVSRHLDDERVHTAILLCSEHRCLNNGYDLRLPYWFCGEVMQHAMFAAAKLNAVLKIGWASRLYQFKELGQQVREMAQSQRDSYYRHWFTSLADELDEKIDSNSSRSFGFGFNPFDVIFGSDEEGYSDGELDFDPECDCHSCRAARRKYEASQR